MRPAGKGPLESLYFDYPRFAARRVPELDGAATRHPVLIVGAGPIGMTGALVLARYGIRSVLIDRKDTFNDGSRAICIARPSMHILERIGAVAPFVKKALGWRFGRSYYRREADISARDAATAGRKISADVQSAAAVHRKIPP
jgi:3-(3-hydroxy-phenyl)propionate hydroxylase